MTGIATIERDGSIAVVTIASPPVNALSRAVREALHAVLVAAIDDPAVAGIVVTCAGRTFFAGADISELGRPIEGVDLAAVCALLEASAKPVVAAIHGTALGGGLEVALACHYRIALPSARMGLPEVRLGLLPGAGGTQRLPRLIGVERALDLMVSGDPVDAPAALGLGLIDALADEAALRRDAVAFAGSAIGRPLPRARDRIAASPTATLFDDYRGAHPAAFRGFRAPGHIMRAVEASVTMAFEDGLRREAELFRELASSPESLAQRAFFFAERETAKVPGLPRDTPRRPVASVGVIGAGTMGGGIAASFAAAGIPVTLVDTSQAALDRGIATIRRDLEASARRGRIAAGEAERRLGLIVPAPSIDALGEADLVIAAVFEEMASKRAIFARLDAVARPGAILASGTSFPDLDAIAAATARPDAVVGLNFVSPAPAMRLLEVVRGARTAPDVVATAMALARTIGKVPVLSGVCDGLIADRIMRRRQEQADALLLEAAGAAAIDAAMEEYGFALGPFRMLDLVGLDVIGRGATASSLAGDLVALGWLGRKRGGGFYDYDEARRATPSPVAAGVIAGVARSRGVRGGARAAPGAIVERLLFPVVNEGAKLLAEGIALRASDIDVAAILGYGWPVHTGGPMFWADTIGLPHIVDTLRRLEGEHGDAFAPSAHLVALAAGGGGFTR